MTRRILIVDDEPAVRNMMKRALREEGYDAVALTAGADGLQAVTHETFDLLITDDYLPQASGAALVKRLRQHCPDLPILHVRSWVEDDVPPVTGEHYLDKPFGLDALRDTVRTLLEQHSGCVSV